MLIVALSVTLAGCSLFDSDPVNPKIIGTGHVVKSHGVACVEIDSVHYVVTEIYTGKRESRTGEDIKIKPVDGMLITVIDCQNNSSPLGGGVHFMVGEWNEAQVEEAFRQNYTFLALFAIFVILGFIYMAFSSTRYSKFNLNE